MVDVELLQAERQKMPVPMYLKQTWPTLPHSLSAWTTSCCMYRTATTCNPVFCAVAITSLHYRHYLQQRMTLTSSLPTEERDLTAAVKLPFRRIQLPEG